MIDRGYRQRAEEYHAKAAHAPNTLDQDWAIYCASVLEEQADFLDRTGRCPEVPLPARPVLHS